MAEQNNITYISVDKLRHHPDNPRFGTGDVTELAESLKAKGCLQNLTVVKSIGGEGEYYVVIGNRRLKAARSAGLTELPCVISSMSRQECVETMLAENMQRQDLTPYEEAKGIQMMLDDFGCTVPDICKKTGLSESTVRRRRKLLDLDDEIMGELDAKSKLGEIQVSLEDYLKVAGLTDTFYRDKVLKSLGTKNFNFELSRALDNEKRMQRAQHILDKLIEAGYTQITKQLPEHKHIRFLSVYNDNPDIPQIPNGSSGFYMYTSSGSYVDLYRTKTAEELAAETETGQAAAAESEQIMEDEQAADDERIEQLRDASRAAYMSRFSFVRDAHITDLEKIKAICLKAAETVVYGDEVDEIVLNELYDHNDEEDHNEEILREIKNDPVGGLLKALFAANDFYPSSFVANRGEHYENENLSEWYDFLEKLGYVMSDEEEQLRDGTHPLFKEE